MALDEDRTLEPFARKLATHSKLNVADHEAILALPWQRVSAKASDYVLREGGVWSQAAVLVSGFAYRHKVTGNGLRQIVAILLPGEAIELQSLHLSVADHNVQCLTSVEIAVVPRRAIRDLTLRRPRIADAILASILVEMSITREWALNLGRRDALTRVAHLLCEFGARLDKFGLTGKDGYNLPMSQQQIGDATGLTSIHVNRMLKILREKGLLHTRGLGVTYPGWEAMRQIGDFSDRYLSYTQQDE